MSNFTPPTWQKDAVLSEQGWRHPKTNELLVSRKIAASDVEAFNNPKPKRMAVLKPVDRAGRTMVDDDGDKIPIENRVFKSDLGGVIDIPEDVLDGSKVLAKKLVKEIDKGLVKAFEEVPKKEVPKKKATKKRATKKRATKKTTKKTV